MLFPRFRSKERDLRSDIDRLSTIHQAVTRALGEADSEAQGLMSRLDDARSRAAFLYGDVIEGSGEEERSNSEMIREAERFLVRGEKRRDELETHTEFLQRLDKLLASAIDALRLQQAED